MFFGSALVNRVKLADINPHWGTARPAPPSLGIALDWWSQIGNEAMRILTAELRCLKILGGGYLPTYGSRLGTSVCVRQPMRLEARDIWMPIEPYLDHLHHVTLDRHSFVELSLTGDAWDRGSVRGWTLQQFSDRLIQPAMIDLAQKVFDNARGADLIVTAELERPETSAERPGVILASDDRGVHLRAMHLRRFPSPYEATRPANRDGLIEVVRFDMLHGALRS